MGHGFGELFKLRGIITYKISPFEIQAFKGFISNGAPNMLRRVAEEFLYVVPPFALAYTVYSQVESAHKATTKKNPADFENDK